MANVKNLNKILNANSHLLKISPHLSFGKIIKRISKSKRLEFVFVKKSRPMQMGAIALERILGKKFFWIQNFENPPTPNFFAKLLIPEADLVIAHGRKEANKLKGFGVKPNKIKIS